MSTATSSCAWVCSWWGRLCLRPAWQTKIGGLVTKFAKTERMLIIAIMVIVGIMSGFLSNTATTALMVPPIATSLAQSLGADPRSMIIATVIACSCAYATPIGMPANTMVVGLGGYKFNDYVKAGLPLIAVSFVICIVLLPILFPFYS